MKIILNLLIILGFALIPFNHFSQDALTNTPIASVEYLDKQPPAEKKVKKKKKRQRKHLKYKLKQQKKQQKKQQNNNRKRLPIYFFIAAGLLIIGLIVWLAYFLPLLISGGLASGGCFAPLVAFVLGFLGIFFGLIILAGIIIFITFAILVIYRNNPVKTGNGRSSNSNQPAEDDFVKIQIQDRASKKFPNLAPETLEKYINLKDSIVELKYERSKLEATEVSGRMKSRHQGKIDALSNRITEKEITIDAIEKSHADLERIPLDKRSPYTNIKIKLAKLRAKQIKYQQKEDLKSIVRLRGVEEDIQEQEEELKLLLGIRKD